MSKKFVLCITIILFTVAVISCSRRALSSEAGLSISPEPSPTETLTSIPPEPSPTETPTFIGTAAAMNPSFAVTPIINNDKQEHTLTTENRSFQTVNEEDIAFLDDFIAPEYDLISEDKNSIITQSRDCFAGTETNWYTIENNGIVYFYYQFLDKDLKPISEPTYLNYAIVGEQYTLHCGIHVGMTEEEVYALLPDCIHCKPDNDDGVIANGVLAWNVSSFPEGWCESYDDIMMAKIEYGEELPWYLGIMLDENGIVKAITTCYPTAG